MYLWITLLLFSKRARTIWSLRLKHKPKAKGAFANMKNLLKTKRAEGFTIIEVMIVLAIAGLIMVIVFIAVPQLQRNQRDNARQNIANRVKAEIETYAGNNQGLYPFAGGAAFPNNVVNTPCGATVTGCWQDFVGRYINGKVKVSDPSSGADVVSNASGVPTPWPGAAPDTSGVTAGQFFVYFGAKCDGETIAASGNANLKTRTYAVMIGLDRTGTTYCVDNG
jgi:prepilin-type N-terminal cleavage/methylation domain-containing protein